MLKSLVLALTEIRAFVELIDLLRPENITLSTLSLKATVTLNNVESGGLPQKCLKKVKELRHKDDA